MSVIAGITAGKFIGGAAILGLLGTSWGHIKAVFKKCFSLFFVQLHIKGQTRRAVQMLLQTEFKCSPLGEKNIFGKNDFVRTVNRSQMVAYELTPLEPTMWWRGYRPMIVSNKDGFRITFLRGVYKKDKLIRESVDKFNEYQKNEDWEEGDRFRVIRKYGTIGQRSSNSGGKSKGDDKKEEEGIWNTDDEMFETSFKEISRPIGWKREEIGQPKKQGAMGFLSLNAVAEEAFESAIRWRNNEKWFKDRCIPWKIGWLIHGTAGTGKTAFVRALGQEINCPIISFDLSTMTNKDFSEAWDNALDYAPCIVLFEDIDGVFKGRENIATGELHQGLSFDCFLNTVDGVENTDGIFKIFTTNRIEHIDPALGVCDDKGMSSRPGRIDHIMEFGILDKDGRIKIAKRVFEEFKDSEWLPLIDQGDGDTGAQFQERCCKLALKLFWDKEEGKKDKS